MLDYRKNDVVLLVTNNGKYVIGEYLMPTATSIIISDAAWIDMETRQFTKISHGVTDATAASFHNQDIIQIAVVTDSDIMDRYKHLNTFNTQ